MKEDDIVTIKTEQDMINLGFDPSVHHFFRVTKVINNQYLGLDEGVDGMLYHKRFFDFTGRRAESKWVCITVPHNAPWMRVGEIYNGQELDDVINVITPARSGFVAKQCFSKARNWEEAKHVFDMMHQTNIENALKFVDWNDDQEDAGNSKEADSSA